MLIPSATSSSSPRHPHLFRHLTSPSISFTLSHSPEQGDDLSNSNKLGHISHATNLHIDAETWRYVFMEMKSWMRKIENYEIIEVFEQHTYACILETSLLLFFVDDNYSSSCLYMKKIYMLMSLPNHISDASLLQHILINSIFLECSH